MSVDLTLIAKSLAVRPRGLTAGAGVVELVHALTTAVAEVRP
jgi:hypothetical protein